MIENNELYLQALGKNAKQASYVLGALTGIEKQALLSAMRQS